MRLSSARIRKSLAEQRENLELVNRAIAALEKLKALRQSEPAPKPARRSASVKAK